MPSLSSKLLEQLLKWDAEVLLPQIELLPHSEHGQTYHGSGVLKSLQDIRLSLRGALAGSMLAAAKLSMGIDRTPVAIGSLIPDDHYFTLRAITEDGLHLTIDRALPSFGGSSGSDFFRFTLECSELWLSSTNTTPNALASRCRMWYSPAPKESEYWPTANSAQAIPQQEYLLLRRVFNDVVIRLSTHHDHLVTDAISRTNYPIRNDIAEKTTEALSYAFGSEFTNQFAMFSTDQDCWLRIRAWRNSRTGILPPIEHSHSRQHPRDVLNVFDKYFTFAAQQENSYHPLSIHLREVSAASREDLHSSLRSLCIAIEAASKYLNFCTTSSVPEAELDAIMAAIQNSGTNPETIERAKGRIRDLAQVTPMDVFRMLAHAETISWQLAKTWKDTRHRIAHGKHLSQSLDTQQKVDAQRNLAELLHALVYTIIGCKSPRTRYSQRPS